MPRPFYNKIVEKNGITDPLKKTLVIIDEAHKLYSDNISSSEKPRVEILEEMIQNSYYTSGNDSVRVLLMTATPYTSDGMEMIKLINLLKPKIDHFPTDFSKFAKKYLNNQGYFSDKGLLNYQNSVSGYVSYINRSQDARNFAYPILENIHVKMTEFFDNDVPDKHVDVEIKEIATKIKNTRAEIKLEKNNLKEKVKEVKAECVTDQKNIIAKCKEDVKEDFLKKSDHAKADKEKSLSRCESVEKKEKKECRENANKIYKDRVAALKEGKKSSTADCTDLKLKCKNDKITKLANINRKTTELKSLIVEETSKKNSIKGVLKEYQAKNREMTESLKSLRDDAKEIRLIVKTLRENVKKVERKLKISKNPGEKKSVNDEFIASTKGLKEAKETLAKLRVKITNIISSKKLARIEIGRAVFGKDISQESALINRCFRKDKDEDEDEDDYEDDY